MRLLDEQRLEALEEAILHLRHVADEGTVVVEGARDLQALEWLGIGGRHVAIHRGHPLASLADELANSAPPIVLLMDWDRSGGRLQAQLMPQLAARVAVDTDCRRRLASACRSKTLEEVPAELAALRRAVQGGRHQGLP
jgi:5S rRNA maturation endonuclease (ribonuclease M5)